MRPPRASFVHTKVLLSSLFLFFVFYFFCALFYLFFTFYDTGAIYFSGTGIVLASLEIKLVIPQGGEASNQTVWEK